jgi:hypothetical protein
MLVNFLPFTPRHPSGRVSQSVIGPFDDDPVRKERVAAVMTRLKERMENRVDNGQTDQGGPHDHADCGCLRSRPRRRLAGALAGEARGVEAHVIHPSSVAVSREHRRAKPDRLDTELLKRRFLGWLRGERAHCSMAHVPTIAEEGGGGYRLHGKLGELIARCSGTESSHDSSLEGSGFELPVRGRGEAGCRAPFDAPGCLGRVGSRPSDPATAEREAQGKIRSQSLTPPQAGQGILRSAHGVVPQFIFITPGPRVSYERGRAPR